QVTLCQEGVNLVAQQARITLESCGFGLEWTVDRLVRRKRQNPSHCFCGSLQFALPPENCCFLEPGCLAGTRIIEAGLGPFRSFLSFAMGESSLGQDQACGSKIGPGCQEFGSFPLGFIKS